MTSLFAPFLPRRPRLVPQTLMPGESISSLVDRQAQIWGVRRWDLLNQVGSIDGWLARRDLDACRKGNFLDIYARETGIGRQELEASCAQRPAPLMRPSWRHAYCPICFSEDASAGYTPYFRLEWARIFLTHCRTHGCPLFEWFRVSWDGERKLPHEWYVGKGPEAPAMPEFKKDLALARAYVCGDHPRAAGSRGLWEALKCFEGRLFEADIGAPHYSTTSRDPISESDLMRKAVGLVRGAVTTGSLQMGLPDGAAFEDLRVVSSVFKTARVHTSSPAWRDLRSGVRSIACRRALLVCLSQQLVGAS